MAKHDTRTDKHDPSDPPARPGRNRAAEAEEGAAPPTPPPSTAPAYAPGIHKGPDADGNFSILVVTDARGPEDGSPVTVHQRDIDGAKALVNGEWLQHVDTLPDGRWRYAKG